MKRHATVNYVILAAVLLFIAWTAMFPSPVPNWAVAAFVFVVLLPKHVHDALSLGAVLSRAVPGVSAAAVIPDVYGIDADRPCTRCALSLHPAWPLAQKERIGELLGWQRAL
jgi:hypothetical protein